MAFVLLKLVEIGPTPGVTKRRFAQFSQRAWWAVGDLWHREMRPKHFTHAGAQEYGYTPRKGENLSKGSKGYRQSYTGRKWRKFGHTYPLVWSGQSRWRTMARDIRALAKGSGVKVVINAPALNFRNARMTEGLNMREEMTAISDDERSQLIARWKEVFFAQLNAIRGPQKGGPEVAPA